MKLRVPRKQSVEGDNVDVARIEEEAKGARKVARFGEMGDERGGEVSVEDMAGFEEMSVGLVGE